MVAGKRPKGRPELLGSLLHKSFDGTGLGERLKDLVIWQHWEQVVGAAIARRARPAAARDARLSAAAARSAA